MKHTALLQLALTVCGIGITMPTAKMLIAAMIIPAKDFNAAAWFGVVTIALIFGFGVYLLRLSFAIG